MEKFFNAIWAKTLGATALVLSILFLFDLFSWLARPLYQKPGENLAVAVLPLAVLCGLSTIMSFSGIPRERKVAIIVAVITDLSFIFGFFLTKPSVNPETGLLIFSIPGILGVALLVVLVPKEFWSQRQNRTIAHSVAT